MLKKNIGLGLLALCLLASAADSVMGANIVSTEPNRSRMSRFKGAFKRDQATYTRLKKRGKRIDKRFVKIERQLKKLGKDISAYNSNVEEFNRRQSKLPGGQHFEAKPVSHTFQEVSFK